MTVKIRDVETREVLKILTGHAKHVDQILFSPDGQSLLTADATQTRLWNIAHATVRFTLPVGKCPMAFTPDTWPHPTPWQFLKFAHRPQVLWLATNSAVSYPVCHERMNRTSVIQLTVNRWRPRRCSLRPQIL